MFPNFEKYWDQEDIHREEDRSYTAHGLMSSFFFYKNNFKEFEDNTLKLFCKKMEKIVASDPDDKSEPVNAICTSFLELIVGEKEGNIIEPHLGTTCREFYNSWQ